MEEGSEEKKGEERRGRSGGDGERVMSGRKSLVHIFRRQLALAASLSKLRLPSRSNNQPSKVIMHFRPARSNEKKKSSEKTERRRIDAGKTEADRVNDLKKEISDFLASVTSTREIVRSPTPFWRLVWTLIFLAILGYCMSEVGKLTQRLMSGPTTTRIKYQVTGSLLFPVVSLCTYARVNGSAIRAQNVSDDLLSYMFSSFKGMYMSYNNGGNQNNPEKLERLEAEYDVFLDSQPIDFSMQKWFMENGISCEQFVASCIFMGSTLPNCCSLITVELTDIGKCFVLTLPKDSQLIKNDQIIPGPFGGLKIYVNMWGEELYPQTIINSNPDNGMQIHLSHPEHRLMVTSDPLIAFPQTHAMIKLNPVWRKMRESEDSDGIPTCRPNPVTEFYGAYSMGGCFTECIAKLTQKACGCVQLGTLPKDALFNSSLLCSPFQATTCVLPLMQDNNVSFLWDKYEIKEECQCPLQCDQWIYEKTVSYSRVPNPGFEKAWLNPDVYLTNNSTVKRTDLDKKNLIILDLYFDNLVCVGGQLSVWLGMRFVTVVQIIIYLVLSFLVMVPFYYRRWALSKGWQKQKMGPDIQFKRPVSLYVSARGAFLPTFSRFPLSLSWAKWAREEGSGGDAHFADQAHSYHSSRRRLSSTLSSSTSSFKEGRSMWLKLEEVEMTTSTESTSASISSSSANSRH